MVLSALAVKVNLVVGHEPQVDHLATRTDFAVYLKSVGRKLKCQ